MADKEFTTPKGTVLPLMVFKRNQKEKDAKGVTTWKEIVSPYLQVAHRLVWFREERPDWGISTELLEHDRESKMAIVKATITNENGIVMAQGTKVEHAAHFSDYLEKAETGAIGRALAMCGYGTQFAPELDEGDRLADAPTQPARPGDSNGNGHSNGNQAPDKGNQAPDKAKLLTELFSLAKQNGLLDKAALNKRLSDMGIFPAELPDNFKPSVEQIQGGIAFFREFEIEEAADRAFA